MTKFSELTHAETGKADWKKLSLLRRIPEDAFKDVGMGWTGSIWLLPCRNEKNNVSDIRRYSYAKLMSVTGMELRLWGMYDLSISTPHAVVWICEGEWDAIALRWLLKTLGRVNEIVVGVPGANTFKNDWIDRFKGKNVILCYDNDTAGDDGAKKTHRLLLGTALTLKFLCWPSARPDGYDINDHIAEGLKEGLPPQRIFDLLGQLIRPKHRHELVGSLPENAPDADPEDKPASYKEVIAVFKKWCRVNQDFEDAVAVSLATTIGIDISGDPLWIELVGPPGCGKTVILMALQKSPRVVFRSSLTPASLISGFNTHPDPSLLPQLHGKCAVFKDGTELLSMNPDAKREIYGTLRGAYDGMVQKGFGNGVHREYRVAFNMLMGVTPAIHGENQANMGERFLRYEFHETRKEQEEKIRVALQNITKEVQMEEELSDVTRRFLITQIKNEDLPLEPPAFLEKIIALAQLLSLLRATVERETFGDREIKYRPVSESGTRPAKQLLKLAKLLYLVMGKTKFDDDILRIIEKVCYSTVIGFHLDILKTMFEYDGAISRKELGEIARMSNETVLKRLADMEHLGVVRRVIPEEINGNGRPHGSSNVLWMPTSHSAKLWAMSKGKPL